MSDVPHNFRWPPPWQPLPLPDGWLGLVRSAEDELKSEMTSDHILHGVVCRAVAYNAEDTNEFLFATNSSSFPLAFVHLTFRKESDSEWPYTVRYTGWDEFRIAWDK